MANKRQKKKKNAQAARQAAAAYKGKNAPAVAKAAAPKKPEPKPEAVVEPKPEIKPEPKPQPEKAVQKAPAQNKEAAKKKSAKQKKKNTKKPNFKKFKAALTAKIKALGIRKLSAIILAVCVAIAAVSVGAWIASSRFKVPKEAIVEYLGREINSSSLFLVSDDLATQYEFADKMQRKGDTELFRYYAATELIFPEKHSLATLNLVNVFDNNCVFIVTIVDDNGNIYYQSLGLPAGNGISDIPINNLNYGTHQLKLVVSAYDPETYEHIGVQYSDITVQVGIEEETTNVEESQN